jgi:preprotein translocase subunit Sec61beta
MTKRKNEYGIKCLFMFPAFKITDPATMAVLQLKTAVEFFPDEFLPDFLDAQNSIRQKFENQKMAVEAAADALIDFFNEYEPKGVKVKVDVINNNAFFPVAVTAESGSVSSVEADEKRENKKKSEKPTGKKTGQDTETDDE